MNIKKKLALLTLGFVTMSSLTAFAASGTSRPWKAELPHDNGPKFFQARPKQHNTNKWIFTVNEMKSTHSVCGWVADANYAVA